MMHIRLPYHARPCHDPQLLREWDAVVSVLAALIYKETEK